jgi:hypothetical protein
MFQVALDPPALSTIDNVAEGIEMKKKTRFVINFV